MSPSVLTMRLIGPEHFPQHVLEPKPTEAEQVHTVKGDGVVLEFGNLDVLQINDLMKPFRLWMVPTAVLAKSFEEDKTIKGKRDPQQRLMGSQIREEVVVVELGTLKGVVT